jgi:hypothetical protein
MKFDEINWTVGFIDTEFGIIELHNIYTREKIYCPLPDDDELEAWAMNILALMRRAYDVGRKENRFTVYEGGASNLRQMADPTGNNDESDRGNP